jgi:ArsR family transcriptional regulator
MSIHETLDDSAIVRVLKALAHPKRFRMVQEIAAAKRAPSCGQVCGSIDVAQPTGSHHLKILVDAGIINCSREGQHAYLSVNQPLLDAVLEYLPRTIVGSASTAPRRRRA